ncbi:MAG: efflux RND transporter permease subunit [Bryobacteraceae bacterium]
MNFSHFFIRRPIFAIVLLLVIVLGGGIAVVSLPIAEYPQITPPTVQVSATYAGADAATVEQSSRVLGTSTKSVRRTRCACGFGRTRWRASD